MRALPLVFGYGGCILLAAAAGSWCASRWRLPYAARIGALLGCAGLVMTPVGELTIVEYLRAVIGDLSIVTQALLAIFLAGQVVRQRQLDERQLRAIMAAALIGAVFLYPGALGLTAFDPYALGYASTALVAALAVLTVAAWCLRFEWLAACLLLAAVGRTASVLESRNLWDYLFDPVLVVYAVFWLSCTALRRALPAWAGLRVDAQSAKPKAAALR